MKKKLSALVLTLVMAAVLAGCGSNEANTDGDTNKEAATADEAITVDLRILATSDTHGMFLPWDYALDAEYTDGSMAQVATAVKKLRTDNTIVVDGGDSIQDNSADLFIDADMHPMVKAMNLIGYDTWTLGNHEFNYGMDNLSKIMGESEATVLCGNVLGADGKNIADGYKIIEKDGVKIAIVGMVTPNIVKWDSANLAECTVNDPVEETKKVIDEIKDQVDVIIAVEHMGESNEYEVANSGAIDLANACPDIDVIVAAHEHKGVEGVEYNGVLVVENKNHGQTLAQVDLTVQKDADGTCTVTDRKSALVTIADYDADPDMVEALSSYDTKAKENAHVVIGKLTGGDLVPANEIEGIPQSQLQETAMVDLINEVQMYYTDADVSAAAVFNTDSNIKEGDIRACDTSLIYKYTNTLYKLEVTGAQLKKYMEWSMSYYNTYKEGDLTVSFNPDVRAYNYDMFAGIKYEVNIANEAGSRVENLTHEDGTPIADDEVLTLAVNNYRASSQLLNYGDVFTEGEDLPKLLEMDVRGDLGGVRELIGDYIVNVKDGVITNDTGSDWTLTGNDWDETSHQAVVDAVKDGKIEIPMSEDGRTPNVKSITQGDLDAL